MTPEEKAKELYDKMLDHNWYNNHVTNRHGVYIKDKMYDEEEAKNCALICVSEIVEQWEYVDTYLGDLGGKLNPNLKYWYEVKKEIESYET